MVKSKKLVNFNGNYSEYLEYHGNKKRNKNLSNDKILLEFRLTKLESEISLEKDINKRHLLEEERDKIISKLKS